MARTKQTKKYDKEGRSSKHPSKSNVKGERSTQSLKKPRKQPRVSGISTTTTSSSKHNKATEQTAGTSESDSQVEASDAEDDEPEAEDGNAEAEDGDDNANGEAEAEENGEKKVRKWSRLTLFKRRVRKAHQQLNDGYALLNEQAAVRCVQSSIHRSDFNNRPFRLKISAVRTVHDIVDICMTQIFSHAHEIVKQSKHSQLNDEAVALSADFWAKHNDLGLLHGANEILKSEFQGSKLL